LIIAQIMRNILDDFSYEFGYINNEDVYDRVFSNFCIGK
jgi:tRNA U34 5-carboxymethylaminomethyl modifying GTPase MnmE/TrmE